MKTFDPSENASPTLPPHFPPAPGAEAKQPGGLVERAEERVDGALRVDARVLGPVLPVDRIR